MKGMLHSPLVRNLVNVIIDMYYYIVYIRASHYFGNVRRMKYPSLLLDHAVVINTW